MYSVCCDGLIGGYWRRNNNLGMLWVNDDRDLDGLVGGVELLAEWSVLSLVVVLSSTSGETGCHR